MMSSIQCGLPSAWSANREVNSKLSCCAKSRSSGLHKRPEDMRRDQSRVGTATDLISRCARALCTACRARSARLFCWALAGPVSPLYASWTTMRTT
eukprot:6174632-Pleurochrysis_carterae.AAC.1